MKTFITDTDREKHIPMEKISCKNSSSGYQYITQIETKYGFVRLDACQSIRYNNPALKGAG